jgi:hypothetical protein
LLRSLPYLLLTRFHGKGAQCQEEKTSAAAAGAMAAARDSFLVVSRSMISFLVSVGTDSADSLQNLQVQGW